MSKQVIQFKTDWQERVRQHRAALVQLQNELVEAETELAEQLAAINAFEFKLRKHIGHLVTRIEALDLEIRALLDELNRKQWDWGEQDLNWSPDEESATSGGEYRYRDELPVEPRPELPVDLRERLKKLYRQLARRFHPDMAIDEADRQYRTQMMMAINAGYAAGDLDRLLSLASEPDAATRVEYARTDRQLAEALRQEIERIQRRVAEIRQELARLSALGSVRLMRRARRASAAGRDFFSELVSDLQNTISHKMVERDVLRSELDKMRRGDAVFLDGDFDDAFSGINLGLDPLEKWERRHGRRAYSDEDILDDGE